MDQFKITLLLNCCRGHNLILVSSLGFPLQCCITVVIKFRQHSECCGCWRNKWKKQGWCYCDL